MFNCIAFFQKEKTAISVASELGYSPRMRAWIGVIFALSCGGSNGTLPTQEQFGNEKPLQQTQIRPVSKGAQGSAERTVASVDSSPESTSGIVTLESEPEPESELELVIPDLEPAVAQPQSTAVRSPLPPVKACQKAPSTADEIVSRMECEYRSIGRYQDTGEVRSVLNGVSNMALFETHFVRPDMFHFEVTSTHRYSPTHQTKVAHSIWVSAGQVHTTTGWERSIEMAMVGFTGVAPLTSHMVPALLMQLGHQRHWMASISPARKRRDDYWAGTTCYRVAVVTRLGPAELWIGSTDFLLRKLTMTGWEIIVDNVDTSSAIPGSVFVKP